MPEYAVDAVTFFPMPASSKKQGPSLRISFTSRALVVCIAAALMLLTATDAVAARRGVRIDFNAWSPAYGPLGNVDCPYGLAGLATWVSVPIDPNHYYLFWSAAGQANYPVVDSYCQHAIPYSPGLEEFDYLNSSTISPDEPGLAHLIGDNKCGGVTAIRYTFLNAFRFDPGVTETGVQWAFYFFPGGQTIVALYSQLEIDELGFNPKIQQSFPDYLNVWIGTQANPDGYFHFQGADYIGPWSGELPLGDGDPVAAETCPDFIFEDSFE